MKKSILLVAVLMALVSLCLVFASCDSGSSDSSDPTPPPEPAPVTYTVIFYANGGSGSMDPVEKKVGEDYTAPENRFIKPKIPVGAVNGDTYIPFAGWNTKADGTGTTYAAGATIESVTANITLYAQWTKPSFTVDASGNKVYFSKGNLYWDGSKYQFEAKQCDYRHYNGKTNDKAVINGEITTTPDGTVGSLFWVKSTETAIKPYDASYGTSSPADATADTFFAATSEKKWRTLSKDEWDYLLNSRTDAAKKVGYGTVCGVNGIILLPDVFTDPMKNNGDGAFIPKAKTDWETNIYVSDNWAAMEAAGAVFLPAAGNRLGSSGNYVGRRGDYWSATPGEYNPGYVYDLDFNGYVMNPDDYSSRDFGLSVRLVWCEN